MVKPKKVEPSDDEIREEWTRDVDEEQVVTAVKLRDEKEWPWQISVAAAEFVLEESLESELSDAIQRALAGVRGVHEAEHEDREVWIVSGRPRGKALVAAVGAVVDGFAPRIREQLAG